MTRPNRRPFIVAPPAPNRRSATARIQGAVGALAISPALSLAVALAAPAGAQLLPQQSPDTHLGVKTCAGQPCHGERRPQDDTAVLQNEHATWIGPDEHSDAYFVLLEPRSEEIARNLGLAQPAHEADLCLDCHADNVPAERRGRFFTLEDGVTCEACHGGASRWMEAHIAPDATHEGNLAAGLYPTDDPVARAELCASCHLGTRDKFVTHRIMGAGHPRMSFELDTFTQVQPAHFVRDEDYRERGKWSGSAAQTWAVGQAVWVREVADALADPGRNRDGIWPEFVLFDCHACHHVMEDIRWERRGKSRPGVRRPGIARLDDSSFLMLEHALRGIDPEAAEELRQRTDALHAAISLGRANPAEVAASLHTWAQNLLPRIVAWQPRADELRTIAESLLEAGIHQGDLRDYAGAEQAVMALQALAETQHALGELDGSRLLAADQELRTLLEATADDEAYRPDVIPGILKRVQDHLVRSLAEIWDGVRGSEPAVARPSS